MKNAGTRSTHGNRSSVLMTAAAATIMVLFNSDAMRQERGIFMADKAAANEIQKGVRERTTPPARDPKEAVEEEYLMARRQGTVQALELFIARHGDDILAEKARADLRRLSK